MKIIVPTRGRTEPLPILEQLASLHPARRKNVIVVCPPSERVIYKDWTTWLTLSDNKRGVTGKLNYVLGKLDGEPFFKLDDDLRIYYRETETKTRRVTRTDLTNLYSWLWWRLDSSKTGGVNLMGNFGSNNLPLNEDRPYGSVRHAYGFRPDVAAKIGFNYRKSPTVAQDLYCVLSLLTNGYPVWTSARFLADEVSSKRCRLNGGWQRLRNPQLVKESFEKLKKLFPDFVRIREVQDSEKMLEHGFPLKLTVAWKRAYEAGLA